MTTSEHAGAVLRPARSDDFQAIERLLCSAELVTAGLDERLDGFWIAQHDAHIVGVAGCETYADGILLRSVAVDAGWRGAGLARALAERVLSAAGAAGARDAYLLTTTAERYFAKLGFERIARDDVPESVRASVEFRGACPASAVAMRRSLVG